MKNDGGPAFPTDAFVDKDQPGFPCKGMSLRDWFAGQAMQGIIASGGIIPPKHLSILEKAIAAQAYVYAEAMLAAREWSTEWPPTDFAR